jgi:hypothetical protein
MSWKPLVSGALGDQVRTVADRIAAELRELGALPSPDPGLAGGRAGLGVALAYHGAVREREDALESAARFLEQAVVLANGQAIDTSLFNGLAGVGWAVEHCSDTSEGDDSNIGVDRCLFDLLRPAGWSGHFDLISGLVGFAVYGLERGERGEALCDRVLEKLVEIARADPKGLTWFTPAALLPPEQTSYAPEGYYNLGLAHGVPGVIAALSALATTGSPTRRDAARRMLGRAVAWLLAQRLADTSSAFAMVSIPGGAVWPARTAWCYGDPGVAAALALAARAAAMPAWAQAARDIARAAAARTVPESGVKDAALCHGALGLSHIYNRLGQALDDDVLLDAARRWLERGLVFERPGESVAGFPKRYQISDGPWHWRPDPGLLEGAAGVLLALDAAASDVEPEWDRVLLLSQRSASP